MSQELWAKKLEYHECLDVTGIPEKILQEIGRILDDVADGTLDLASDILTTTQDALSVPTEIVGNATRETIRVAENVRREIENTGRNVEREVRDTGRNVEREVRNTGRNVERETRRAVCNIFGCKMTNISSVESATEFSFSDELCVDVAAEVALIFDGAFFIRMRAFGHEYKYKLDGVHDNCTQFYNFGIGALYLCYKDIQFDGKSLKSVRLAVEVKVGFRVKYGDFEKDLSTSREILNTNVELV